MAHDFPWLVADVGGTNARFGLVRSEDLAVTHVRSLRADDHFSLEAAAAAYMGSLGEAVPSVRRAAFALAAPVDAEPVILTNRGAWSVSRAAMARALGADAVLLLNDFEALALALPRLGAPDGLRFFGRGHVEPQRPMVVLGPGTGLGLASCVPAGDGRWIAVAAEGGHVTLAAGDAFEDALLGGLRVEYEHISAERLLSGIGLPTLHQAVCRVRGVPAELIGPEEITRRALELGDPDALATLERFCAMLGGFAGNAALTLGAAGGVYIAGGIAQKLGDLLTTSAFRERFEAKGRYRGYLSRIATALVVAPHPALDGAVAALAQGL
jgi:glucokinase